MHGRGGVHFVDIRRGEHFVLEFVRAVHLDGDDDWVGVVGWMRKR